MNVLEVSYFKNSKHHSYYCPSHGSLILPCMRSNNELKCAPKTHLLLEQLSYMHPKYTVPPT